MTRALLIAGALLSSLSFAQGTPRPATAPSPRAEVRFKRVTVLDFFEEVVEGDLVTPDVTYLEVKPVTRHSSLVRVRQSFREKVMQSVNEF